MKLIVSNTGPLMHLSQANALDLIQMLGGIHIPSAVVTEVTRHVPSWASAPPAWIHTTPLHPTHAAQALAWEKAGLLDRGEAEALALTQQLNADWFLTDDTAARVLATSLSIEVHGSLGIVLWAAATGHLDCTEAKAALHGLAASTLWLSARGRQEAQDALDKIFPPSKP
jgi:predicted nucleic acid-binding protein